MSRDWIEVQWKDNDDIERTLHKIKVEIKDELDKIMLQAAVILEGEIKKVIKEKGLVDTGYLRMNWTSFVENRLAQTVGIVATNTEYAPYLEKGTKNEDGSVRIKAYKFGEIAYNRVEDKISRHVESELKKLVGGSYA